ncbi:MAG: hypothetical protein IPN33_03560 [Saprospiraceae bacterium]|nr:hypothetical protein [Saprospiraceae bacterium]
MKKIITVLLLCFSAVYLSAQEETLFGDLHVVGAFGAPILEVGAINGEIGADVGGGGALVLNNMFIGGYGMGTSYPEYVTAAGDERNIRFKHGGFWLGYTPKPHKVAHLYSSLKIGWGSARLREDGDNIATDRLFALTPELGIEINLTRFVKVSLSGGYRWINGISKLDGLDNESFSSPTGLLTFRIGGWSDSDEWDRW